MGWRDIEDIVRDLAAGAVHFERYDGLKQDQLGIWDTGSGSRVAWFKDPDGNVLSLTRFGS